jgi:hypothetical protein
MLLVAVVACPESLASLLPLSVPQFVQPVGAFLAARYGRKARLKIGLDGEVEAEAQTVKQIEKLMKVAEKHRREKDSE